METSHDVRVWKLKENRGKRRTTYSVRWIVAGKEFHETYATSALADAERSDLITAMSNGKAFSLETGRPVSPTSGAAAITWYDFAVQFCDAQWRRTSGNNRKNVAKALAPTTIAMLRSAPNGFRPVDVRTALREWAFNTKRRSEAPPELAVIIKWVRRNSLPMSAWEDPQRVEDVLHAVSTKLDDTAAAASTTKRNRRILNMAMEYAVKRRILRANPLPKGRGAMPRTSFAVDKRSLVNPTQAAALLGWVWRRPRGGPRLHAFLATIYYAGARPEEVVAMRVEDVHLPEEDAADQWGELLLATALPEVGRQWTDSGEVHEERGLKGRAAEDTRPVPCRPALTRILREHIAAEELKPGGLMFQGERGGMMSGSVFRRAWRSAREQALTPTEYASPLGRRVYDLRHTCLTNWLNAGVPPAEVAEWAGNSVPVLLATYARCISGQLSDLKARVDAGGQLPHPADDD
ncbi:tyrosine-type recombinase/integrase [Streptomyces sp. A7024]|uniref:Tyrosine-type recombinase/integrase n=1 Tax=Streptomyces coryli TaxID=1128680 RepID=A0A6G4TXP8_9ACTN|nr:tyrosine-type recombinase/integrase [Streptomyces coryli]NGN63888.1 tyrosine-type recombinase/integrase [Streptomyces coryli]